MPTRSGHLGETRDRCNTFLWNSQFSDIINVTVSTTETTYLWGFIKSVHVQGNDLNSVTPPFTTVSVVT